jgi:hypothetical protein
MVKVLITISGGNVQRIASTSSNVQFIIEDIDNLEAVKTKSEVEEIFTTYDPDSVMDDETMQKEIDSTILKYSENVR